MSWHRLARVLRWHCWHPCRPQHVWGDYDYCCKHRVGVRRHYRPRKGERETKVARTSGMRMDYGPERRNPCGFS